MVAVIIKAVVLPTVTTPDPLTGLTLPITGEIDTDVAPLTFQLSVADPPAATVSGAAVKELMTGSPVAGGVAPPLPETSTCAEALVAPYWLVAVIT